MRANKIRILAGLVAAQMLALAAPGLAAELGMPAPPLSIETWVKGNAVDLAAGKGKSVYVVDFWATWCGPCRESIPHLTALQKKYAGKGVVFVGVSNEALGAVKPFVEKMGANMDYVVALDKTKLTTAAYLEAFGIDELPQAFIVDKTGAIAWFGSPTGMEEVLEKVVAGKYDVEAVKKKSAELDRLLEGYFELVTGDTLDPKAPEAGGKFVDQAGDNAKMLDGFAWTILTHKDVKFRDLALATRASKAAVDATKGTNYSYLDTYARALFDSGKTAEGIKYQQEAIAKCTDPKEKAELVETLAEFQKAAVK
jgi:thiol-disulfide isomerase/thioredoxin